MSMFDMQDLEVAKDLIKELRKSRETKERIQLEEIDARDRVDISLKMYEELRNKIQEYYEESKKLEKENNYLKGLLEKIGIPEEAILNIDPESVTVGSLVDHVTNPSLRKYKIEFMVEMSEVEVR